MDSRDGPRFFGQVGHPTANTSIENKDFFTKSWPLQTYQNYEQPCERSQNCEFQSHFSMSKIGRIFPKKDFLSRIFDCKTNLYQWNFLKTLIFNVLYLLKMCPIFVSSVHKFGKSDDDIF